MIRARSCKEAAGTWLSLQSFARDKQKDFRLHPSRRIFDIETITYPKKGLTY
jgi:hypothetical protein